MLALLFLSFLSLVYGGVDREGHHQNELKRLFHSRTQLSLMEKDTVSARRIKENGDASKAAYPHYQSLLKDLRDSERLTEESYARRRYQTIEEAQNAINNWKDHEQFGQVEKDWHDRKTLIERYPKWFIQKKYYEVDPFGMEMAKKLMKKEGEGQTIIVLDQFGSKIPERLLERCANPERFLGSKQNSNGSNHGVSVASVAVDPEFGVAPKALFKAKTLNDIFPKHMGPNPIPYLNDYVQANITGLDYRVLAGIDRVLARGDETIGVEFEATGMYYEIQVPDLSEFNGAIVNMSIQYMDSIGEMRNLGTELHMVRLISFASLILQMVRRGAVIVWASGNNSLILQHAEAYSVLKSLSLYKPWSFISVLALDEDATSIAPLSNQPGEHALQNFTIAAPGTNVRMLDVEGNVVRLSGTSAAAPYIAGIIALLKSNLPGLPNSLIPRAILDTASPVIIRHSHSRIQNVPVVISGIEGRKLVPSKTYFYKGKDGKDKEIFVTQDMIIAGRAKYGAGRVNLFRAYMCLYSQLKPSQAK